MEENKSKVYALLDEQNRVLRIEGGYSMSNIDDISKWTYIDEGNGDRYNLCQNNYLPKPVREIHGVPVYEYKDGKIVERPAEDIEKDIAEAEEEARKHAPATQADFEEALKRMGGGVMTKPELDELVERFMAETKEALQLLYDNVNKGQRKQIVKNEQVKKLFDKYGVKYES